MNHVAAFLLRMVAVACRARFGHWSEEHGHDGPCVFETAADDYDGKPKPLPPWVRKMLVAGAASALVASRGLWRP
jgi:hypothetical protein